LEIKNNFKVFPIDDKDVNIEIDQNQALSSFSSVSNSISSKSQSSSKSSLKQRKSSTKSKASKVSQISKVSNLKDAENLPTWFTDDDSIHPEISENQNNLMKFYENPLNDFPNESFVK
jgi:hypothetical protein